MLVTLLSGARCGSNPSSSVAAPAPAPAPAPGQRRSVPIYIRVPLAPSPVSGLIHHSLHKAHTPRRNEPSLPSMLTGISQPVAS
jgi:hypothetical protein